MTNGNNGQNAGRYLVFAGQYGREYESLEDAMARLEELRAENVAREHPWRATDFRRCRDGTVEFWVDGFYYEASYRPRQWRC